jgi:hypothetical protein
MADPIFETIFQTLYRYRIECGPNKSAYQYVPKAYNISVFDVPYIVPDQTIKPKTIITIDFNHTYAIGGERLVSETTLRNTTKELLNFFYYYFEYELSYNKSWTTGNTLFKDALSRSKKLEDLDSMSEFINYIMNFFLTSISVQRKICEVGTASFTLKDNWNVKTSEKIRLFFNKTVGILNQLLVPMLPVMIWSQGRIYKDWIFPLFDGFITSVTDANSEGFISITVNCRDGLEVARFSHEMVNPAIVQYGEREGKTQNQLNMFQMPFYNIDHFKIVQAMFLGGSIVWDSEKGKTRDVIVGKKKSGFQSFDGIGNYELIADFYEDESYTDRVLDKTPVTLAEDRAIKKDEFCIYTALAKTSHKRPRNVVTWGAQITPYRVFSFTGIDVFQSNFDSRLSILQDVARLVYYQLYVDSWGNIQYHPYRLATNFIKYDLLYFIDGEKIEHENIFPGAQIIGPEESFSSSAMYNIEELITHLRLVGVENTTQITPELGSLIGGATATTLESRFGYRRAELTCPLINDPIWVEDDSGEIMRFPDFAARELLMFMNAELYSRSDTIVFRPELELAMPICIMPGREIFYVQSITHTIEIGGTARTEISSNFGRDFLSQPPDVHNLMIQADQYFKGNKPLDLSSPIRKIAGTFINTITTKYEAFQKEVINIFDFKKV